MSYSIPISGLNEMVIISIDDFIPIVDSSSLTTFRVSVKNLGNALTTSSSSWASQSLSSSYSPWADYANSASWASQSLSSSWANNAAHVNLTGSQYYFPFWYSNKVNGWEVNGCLDAIPPGQSALYYYDGGYSNVIAAGVADMNSAPVLVTSSRPDYYISSSFDSNAMGFWGNNRYGYGGLWSTSPIISTQFVGTDQIEWCFSGSVNTSSHQTNQVWSGSLLNGFMSIIPPTDSGLADTFNGKWVRIVCAGGFPSYPHNIPSDAAPYGERNGPDSQGIFGRMRIWSNGGTANIASVGSNQIIDMHIDSQIWSGGTEVDVFASSHYGYDFIRKIRISKFYPEYIGDIRDPLYSIDLFIDGITDDISEYNLRLQSWGGILFLRYLNLDPPPIVCTGSADQTKASYLTFPAAPGHYGTHTLDQNYYIQGHNVVITPSYNVLTESYGYGTFIPISPYALHTDGTIDSDCYYCGDHQGLTTKVTISGIDLYFSGGILVSGTLPPTPPTPPSSCEGPFYKGGNLGMPVAPIYCNLGTGTGNVNFYYLAGNQPTRYMISIGNTLILDTGYRFNGSSFQLNTDLAPYGSSSSDIVPNGTSGTLTFVKTTAQNVATVSVFRPTAGDLWHFTLYCPS